MATLTNSFGNHGQSTLNDGRIIVSGGLNDSTYYNNAYIYNTDSNIWANAKAMLASFQGHSQSKLNDGKILISGGGDSSGLRNTVYVYDVNDNTWSNMATMSVSVIVQRQSTLLNGNVLNTGGGTGGGSGLRNTALIYTPTGAGSWSSAANFIIARDVHGQSTLLDGRVLISGGRTNNSGGTSDTSYAYNTITNAWVRATNMPNSFGFHSQSTLADGRVLISGGNNASGRLSTAYIYTPVGWDINRYSGKGSCRGTLTRMNMIISRMTSD